MSAVTPGDQNTDFAVSLAPHEECTNLNSYSAQDWVKERDLDWDTAVTNR